MTPWLLMVYEETFAVAVPVIWMSPMEDSELLF
jgi:hypothetical protein